MLGDEFLGFIGRQVFHQVLRDTHAGLFEPFLVVFLIDGRFQFPSYALISKLMLEGMLLNIGHDLVMRMVERIMHGGASGLLFFLVIRAARHGQRQESAYHGRKKEIFSKDKHFHK